MLRLCGGWQALAGRSGRRGGRDYRTRRGADCSSHGRTILAACLRAFLAVSHGCRRKIGYPHSGVGTARDARERARLFYVGRIRSDGDSAETRAAVLDRARRNSALPRDFAAAELPRQHAGSAFGFRKRYAPRTFRAFAEGVGTYRAVFLLPLSFWAEVSGMQCGLRGRSRAFAGARWVEGRGRVYFRAGGGRDDRMRRGDPGLFQAHAGDLRSSRRVADPG